MHTENGLRRGNVPQIYAQDPGVDSTFATRGCSAERNRRRLRWRVACPVPGQGEFDAPTHPFDFSPAFSCLVLCCSPSEGSTATGMSPLPWLVRRMVRMRRSVKLPWRRTAWATLYQRSFRYHRGKLQGGIRFTGFLPTMALLPPGGGSQRGKRKRRGGRHPAVIEATPLDQGRSPERPRSRSTAAGQWPG